MSNTDQIANWEVLIVDDDLGTREVIAHTLSFYGATVHTANNGTEGLALLEHISPTMILLDLHEIQLVHAKVKYLTSKGII